MKSKFYIMGALASMGLASCDDYLDKEVDLSLQVTDVFTNEDNTRGYLATIYDQLPDAFKVYTDEQFTGASRDCMTDNAISYWDVHYHHAVLTDSYTAKTHKWADMDWGRYFGGIRSCNTLIKYADPDVVGNAETDNDNNRLCDRYKAEARFLRALYHFELAAAFGDVPMQGDDANGDPIILVPGTSISNFRTPCAEVLKWVADECDKAAAVLPFRYKNEVENWGRVNGAAAYALKSRALLYRASKLHNPDNNLSWWKEAADAALEFIDKNAASENPYSIHSTGHPEKDYYDCFCGDEVAPHINNEYILSRSEWNTLTVERMLSPCGFAGKETSVGRTNPTQNLVDSYETINGLPINEDPEYDDQNPYKNRDPRLEQTIIHHGSIWGDPKQEEERAIDVAPGGLDYQELHGGTTTGYYTKKFMKNMSFKDPKNSLHACPIFRYAEVLLNAAEALNECGKTADAYKYVNEVRARVGMPEYQGMTQDRLRERLRNERRIELCFEDHRFFDERRWMLFDENVSADAEKNKPRYQQVYNIYSASVTGSVDDASYTYIPNSKCPKRVFNSPKNYYFPIPYNDVKGIGMKQNEGWD